MWSVDALQAFAEPRRREILDLVRGAELTVGEIASRCAVSAPAISQHLKVLREAGLVRSRHDGPRRLYTIRPEGVAEVHAYVEQFWSDGLVRLKDTVEGNREVK